MYFLYLSIKEVYSSIILRFCTNQDKDYKTLPEAEKECRVEL